MQSKCSNENSFLIARDWEVCGFGRFRMICIFGDPFSESSWLNEDFNDIIQLFTPIESFQNLLTFKSICHDDMQFYKFTFQKIFHSLRAIT